VLAEAPGIQNSCEEFGDVMSDLGERAAGVPKTGGAKGLVTGAGGKCTANSGGVLGSEFSAELYSSLSELLFDIRFHLMNIRT